MEIKEKTCITCKKELILAHFELHLRRRILKNGTHQMKPYYRNSCKSCRKGSTVVIHQERENFNLSKREKQYVSELKFKYGLSLEEYKKMLIFQDSKCKICKEDLKLNVDHCHTTGKVRGLLCRQCNHGLGNFKDSPELLLEAIKYLS